MLPGLAFSHSSHSLSVKTALPLYASGRSKGILLRKSYVPCMSGSPDGVFGGVYVDGGGGHFARSASVSPCVAWLPCAQAPGGAIRVPRTIIPIRTLYDI